MPPNAAPSPSQPVAQAAAPPLWTLIPRALWPIVLALGLASFLHFVVAPRVGGFGADILINSGIAIILAVSLTVVNGFTGQFSIGHAGFMSLGGYFAVGILYYASYRWFGNADFHGGRLSFTGSGPFVGALLDRGDLLFVGGCFAGAVFAAIVGWIVGLPALRLRGDYLAIVTLGFGEIVRVILQGTGDQLDATSTDPGVNDVGFLRLLFPMPTSWKIWQLNDWTLPRLGGALGFTGGPAYTTVFWVWVAAIVTIAATIRLKHSSYGRAMLAIREDEIAARATGVNTTKYKVRAFLFSSFFAGLAGGLYAMKVGTINAGELAFSKSFDIIIMVVLGGLGSISGAALAATLLTILPELLRQPPSLYPRGLIGVAVVVVLILALAPGKRGPLITLAAVCLAWEGIRWLAPKFGINLADYRMIIYALALIVMMIVRPQGLFGIREIWDYLPMSWQFWRRMPTEAV